MERFDILGKNGEPTGLVADKGTSLKGGQYYLGVHAYIYNYKNEFLLQRRALDKVFLPGGWDIHMGHVVAGETSREGMIREIREELALVFPQGDMRLAGRILWEEYHHMIDVYFLRAGFELGRLSLQEDEVIEVKLVSADEMLSLVSGMNYRPPEYRQLAADEIGRITAAADEIGRITAAAR